MEWCDGNLEWFRKTTRLLMAEQVALMEQVAAACAWIVRQGCVHGNLKMQNILIAKTSDSQGNRIIVAKVADFGFFAIGGGLTEKSDILSFGHILLQTFCPHRFHEPTDRLETVADGLAGEWTKTDPWIKEQQCKEAALWICKAVDLNPESRPSFSTVGMRLAQIRESAEQSRQRSQRLEQNRSIGTGLYTRSFEPNTFLLFTVKFGLRYNLQMFGSNGKVKGTLPQQQAWTFLARSMSSVQVRFPLRELVWFAWKNKPAK
eukprot:5885957-Amphidinium_carterae.1